MNTFSNAEVWDTTSVEPKQSVAYWVDAICSAFLDMNAAPRQRDDFAGRVARTRVGDIGLMQVTSVAQDVRRDAQHIARSDTDSLYLISQLSAPWAVSQGRECYDLRPGDCVLIDSSRPYSFSCPGKIDNLSIELPRPWLARWFARPDVIGPRLIARDSQWGGVLGATMESLREHAIQPSQTRIAHETDVSSLLAAVLQLAVPEHAEKETKDFRWEKIDAVLNQRFREPGLTASDIAESVGISLATLHRVFATRMQTFADTLRQKRLAAAREMLANPRLDHVQVAEIGRRSGFADASHFSKQFARDAGMSPRRWRATSL
ncbi:MAG: helix-turn-helix domain-containing protein [Burkholderiales bacterium]|nr:MAG: helix-turn-helix domain-containing protein [Betaproteobacteria bacterium]TAG23778.1 MAG: helix-turn-helix domain-containing protein [Burkholderiales bacterium]